MRGRPLDSRGKVFLAALPEDFPQKSRLAHARRYENQGGEKTLAIQFLKDELREHGLARSGLAHHETEGNTLIDRVEEAYQEGMPVTSLSSACRASRCIRKIARTILSDRRDSRSGKADDMIEIFQGLADAS